MKTIEEMLAHYETEYEKYLTFLDKKLQYYDGDSNLDIWDNEHFHMLEQESAKIIAIETTLGLTEDESNAVAKKITARNSFKFLDENGKPVKKSVSKILPNRNLWERLTR